MVSEAALKEITTLRMEFESMALQAAIAQGDLVWEGNVVGMLHRLRRTGRAPSGEGLEQWERAHRDFHMALLSACDMPLLLNIYTVFTITATDIGASFSRPTLAIRCTRRA